MREVGRLAVDQQCIGRFDFWCKPIESPLLGIFAFGILAIGAVFYYLDWRKEQK
jgi:hypothetical protein